ncbi:hypothetical protein Gogos_005621 [Gossypium gossypioides]|uniref:RNase H type-1 domain-containing protein n=1 Tax=Gossypium gossypioides TaxID=34282 RepID=A0A7J9D5N2_GOSGO|nr:hypothetical protein [Gossypium gossypioides]
MSIVHAVKTLKIGFGWQIRDGRTARYDSDRWGFEGLNGGRMVYLDYKLDIQWAEAEALREGIVRERNNNVARAILETDCEGLVNHKSVVEWVARSSNRVVDGLCKLAIDKHCTFSFNMEHPSDIHGLVLADAC